MKVYLASSWRNTQQPSVVAALRAACFDVYDFRNPKPGDTGFSWSAIDPNWRDWTPLQYISALKHPIAQAGFKSDMDALRACDTCVLLLPSGRSAHLEAGWAAGAGKRTIVLQTSQEEPELMALMCDSICTTVDEVIVTLLGHDVREPI